MSNSDSVNRGLERLENNQSPVKQIPIDMVDDLADELVAEYSNPDYRRWYCSAIYDFGLEQVNKWRQRAATTADSPAKLFTYYVNQARKNSTPTPVSQPAASSLTPGGADKVYDPTDDDLTDEGIARLMDKAQPGKATPWMNEDD